MLFSASPAFAHGALKRASPRQSARLDTVPRSLRLTFNEAPVLAFARLTLDGPNGPITLGDLHVDSSGVLVAEIQGAIAAGVHTVRWQIAGKDGHPVRGSYTFTVLPTATGLNAPVAQTITDSTAGGPGADARRLSGIADSIVQEPRAPTFDASSPAYVIIRWLTYIGLLGIIGAVAFTLTVLPRFRRLATATAASVENAAARRAASLGAAAGVLLIVATALRLVAQSFAVSGRWDAGVMGASLFSSMWGWGWISQIALAAISLAAFLLIRRSAGRGAWTLVVIAAALLAFTPGLAGHAAAVPRYSWATIIANGLHIIGAAGWIGSLAMLLLAGIPAAMELREERGQSVAHMVRAFSPVALLFAGLLAATGVFAAWIHLSAFQDLWQTAYGSALFRKLVVLALVAGTGLYNWRRVGPSLGDEHGVSRIRRSGTAELLIALVVLVLTAVLVATPTPVAPT